MAALTCPVVALCASALVTALAAIGAVYWPTLYFNQLTKRLILSNTSMSYELWRETPIPMYLELYMWNMSNADAVLADRGAVKPSFTQMGPYVFRESHIKTNLSWHPENGTVTFYNNRTWHYEPDMSNGTLDDQVTNVNVVLVAIVHAMRLQPLALRPFVNTFLLGMHEHLLLTATVRDWVFDGIPDPVIHWAVEHDIDVGIPYDRFGWFYNRNGSEVFDGVFNMETGAADVTRLGNVAQWQHSPRTPFRGACGLVQGSTGELWPPQLGQDDLSIFASDLCTYMTLHKERNITQRGVPGVRYIANASVFDNGHNYPAMACYCEDVASADCVSRGALNVSICRFGAPAFVSFPHFYNADPSYLDKVDGLRPTKEEHEFYVGLEVLTGIPLEVRAQLQINLLVRHVTGMGIGSALPPDTMVPMFWFRQEVLLTDDYAAQARLALAVRAAVLYALYSLSAAGLCVLAGAAALLVRRLVLQAASPPLLSATSPERDSSPPPPGTG